MATTASTDTLIPETDDERRLVAPSRREEGIGLPLSKDLTDGVSGTRARVSGVTLSVDSAPEERVSFAKACDVLGQNKMIIGGKECIGLEAVREEVVNMHRRWGLVDAYVEAGFIKDEGGYGALFDTTTINAADLRKVCASLDRGEKLLPIFDADMMPPDKLCTVLFDECGVPIYQSDSGTFTSERLQWLRQIDSKHFNELAGLAERPTYEQWEAFEEAYRSAAAFQPTGARINFTPDILKVKSTGFSAVNDIQAYVKDKKAFLGPNANMLRMRLQMDARLRKITGRDRSFDDLSKKGYRALVVRAFERGAINRLMPDANSLTRCSDWIFHNGGVLSIGFSATRLQQVVVAYGSPYDVGDASRSSLG